MLVYQRVPHFQTKPEDPQIIQLWMTIFSIETHGFGEPPHMLTPENPPETVTNMLMIFLHGDF